MPRRRGRVYAHRPVSVEPAKQEESRVGQERSVIISRRRRLAEGGSGLILQGRRGNEGTPHEGERMTGEATKTLTKVKQEQFRAVLRAVAPTRNEKVGTYLCRRM
jgi:hypothetical protein